MARIWMALGAVFGLLAVAMAAYAAHGLDEQAAALADTGASLGGWHAVALVGAGLLAERRRGVLVNLAPSLFTLGVLLFCGGLYIRALAGVSLGFLVPLGGMALLLGWAVFAVAALLAPQR